jgi:hypothetical protein
MFHYHLIYAENDRKSFVICEIKKKKIILEFLMFLFFNFFFSRFLKDTLQRYKVNTENCVTCTNGLKTPTSIVITNKQNGSRTILHHGKLVKLCHICI